MKYVVVTDEPRVIGPYSRKSTADTRCATLIATGAKAQVLPLTPDSAYFGKPVGNRTTRIPTYQGE